MKGRVGISAMYLARSILFRFGLVLYFLDEGLNFQNEHRKIGLGKTHLWRGDAVVSDVWEDVLVMRMSALQSWIVRMWLRVKQIQLYIMDYSYRFSN